MKIKLSKSQWQFIGKKAGWMEDNATIENAKNKALEDMYPIITDNLTKIYIGKLPVDKNMLSIKDIPLTEESYQKARNYIDKIFANKTFSDSDKKEIIEEYAYHILEVMGVLQKIDKQYLIDHDYLEEDTGRDEYIDSGFGVSKRPDRTDYDRPFDMGRSFLR